MSINFTEHPILKPPTDEEIVLLGEADPKLLQELHRAHEGRIAASADDPIRHGFNLPGWERMSGSFREYNEVMTCCSITLNLNSLIQTETRNKFKILMMTMSMILS